LSVFVQAEDGIRVFHVTGVHTCALPICRHPAAGPALDQDVEPVGTVLDVLVEGGTSGRVAAFRLAAGRALVRGSRHHRHRAYLPRAEALSVSSRTLVVPAHTPAYVAHDLTAAVSRDAPSPAD